MTKRIYYYFDMIVEFERSRHTTNSPNSWHTHSYRNRIWNLPKGIAYMRFVVLCLWQYAVRVCTRCDAVRVRDQWVKGATMLGAYEPNHTHTLHIFGVEFEFRLHLFYFCWSRNWIRVRTHSPPTETTSNVYVQKCIERIPERYRETETRTNCQLDAQSRSVAAADALTHNALNRKPIND